MASGWGQSFLGGRAGDLSGLGALGSPVGRSRCAVRGWSSRNRDRGERKRGRALATFVSATKAALQLFSPFCLRSISWVLVTRLRPCPAPTCPFPFVPGWAGQRAAEPGTGEARGREHRLGCPSGFSHQRPHTVHSGWRHCPSAASRRGQRQEWVAGPVAGIFGNLLMPGDHLSDHSLTQAGRERGEVR